MLGTGDAVGIHVDDGIAVIRIDNPPINAGSLKVRSGLCKAIAIARAEGVSGAILIGAGRTFIAGADLKEFGQPLAAPELPDVIRAVEDAPFPVAAALHGVALGGGLELALGCDCRVAAPGTQLGLPEVSLGIVPGAGGTQRLPRLVGRAMALDLICTSRRIDAQEALRIGMIDTVVHADLLAGARDMLMSLRGAKRRVIEMPVPPEPLDAFDDAVAEATKRGGRRPNVDDAIRLVRSCGSVTAAVALADERAAFQRLRMSPDAFALRHLFFAERRAGVVDGLDRSAARPVRSVGVIGSGAIGRAIAAAALDAGLPVLLAELDETAAAAAVSATEHAIADLVAEGRLSAADADSRRNKLRKVASIGDLGECDLVVEAVAGDIDAKRAVLRALDRLLAPEAIIAPIPAQHDGGDLASIPAQLDCNDLTSGLAGADRVLCLQPFGPAERMQLLEIIRCERTSDATLATGLAVARLLGMQPVVSRGAGGSLGNRIHAAYRRSAELLVLEGASPRAVDEAVRDFGFAMGPFEASDLYGPDFAGARRGRPAASDGVAGGRGAAGIDSADDLPDKIQRRLMAAIVNEAAILIAEGVAQRASDIDVMLVHGFGFPRWRGGPLYWAARQDPARLDADLRELADRGVRLGPVRAVLASLGGSED